MAEIITPKARYVPPHLRERQPSSPSTSSAGPSNYASSSQSPYSPRNYTSSFNRTQRPTHDSSSSPSVRRPLILNPARPCGQPAFPSPETTSSPLTAPLVIQDTTIAPSVAVSSEKYRAPGKRYTGQSSPPLSDIFAPSRPKSVAPNGVYGDRFCDLHIYGDSFVGPFSLLRPNSVYIRKFKGASAKGLNNLKSFKRVALELVPDLARAMAEGPRSDTKLDRRNAMLMFGNVSWQKRIRESHSRQGRLADQLPISTPEPATYRRIIQLHKRIASDCRCSH